jgi:hypothetical protein
MVLKPIKTNQNQQYVNKTSIIRLRHEARQLRRNKEGEADRPESTEAQGAEGNLVLY